MLNRFLCTTAIAAFFSLSLTAADLPQDVMAVVKFPPPKTFTAKAMAVARAIQPGQQTEMMPLIFLGAVGYPNYPGISETDNVSVFIFDSDIPGEIPYVVLAKIGQDSPIRQLAGAYQVALEDRDDWVLIAKDPSYLGLVGDLAPYVEFNKEAPEFDIEARFFLGKDKVQAWVSDLKQMIEERHTEASGGKYEAIDLYKKIRFVDFLAAAGENLNWAEIGIDLSAETVAIGTIVDAVAGTPEAAILNAPAGGAVPVAEFIPAEGMMNYTSKMSIEAFTTYYDVLEARAMGLVGDKGKAWLTETGKLLRAYLPLSDGTSAGSFGMSEGVSDMVSVCGGTYTNDIVVSTTKAFANKLLPELFNAIPYFKRHGFEYTFVFTENVSEIEGTPVHELQTTFTMTPPTLSDDEESALPETLSEPVTQTQSNFYAVVDGKLLSTSSLEDMSALVPAVKAGIPVDGNIGQGITLGSGEAMGYTMNLTEYFTMGLGDLPDDAPGAEQMKAVVAELQAAQLDPATGVVSTGNNRLKATFSLPVSSLAKVTQGFQKMQPADPTYQMDDSGENPLDDSGGM